MTSERLLWLAERLCGAETRRNVFEPLVADWQREYRDARAARARARILVRGGVAFLVALAICVNPFRGANGAPARHFLWTVFGFALAATLLQLGPFQVFIWQHLTFRWDLLLLSPQYFATGVALALLPGAMLAAQRLTAPRLVITVTAALAAAFVARDVVAPRSEQWLQDLRRQELVGSLRVSVQINWERRWLQAWFADIVRRDVDKTRLRAQLARIERHQQAAFAVMAAAFALLGLAVGRARNAAPRIGAAAAWWFSVWIGYQLLQFQADRLRIVLPTPVEVAIWLPPLTVLIVGLTALVAAGGPESPRYIADKNPRNQSA